MYHVKPDGSTGICRAKPGNYPYNTIHAETKEEIQAIADTVNENYSAWKSEVEEKNSKEKTFVLVDGDITKSWIKKIENGDGVKSLYSDFMDYYRKRNAILGENVNAMLSKNHLKKTLQRDYSEELIKAVFQHEKQFSDEYPPTKKLSYSELAEKMDEYLAEINFGANEPKDSCKIKILENEEEDILLEIPNEAPWKSHSSPDEHYFKILKGDNPTLICYDKDFNQLWSKPVNYKIPNEKTEPWHYIQSALLKKGVNVFNNDMKQNKSFYVTWETGEDFVDGANIQLRTFKGDLLATFENLDDFENFFPERNIRKEKQSWRPGPEEGIFEYY